MIPHEETIRAVAASATVYFPMAGATIATLTATAQGSAWGTAVLTIKWANVNGGATFAFGNGEAYATTIGPGDGAIPWISVSGKAFLCVVATTAEGADETINLCVNKDK